MFSKHGRYKDTRPFDNVVTGRCFARVLPAAALFLFMAFHAGAASAGDGFGERFGGRAWAGWCEGRADLGWNFYCDPEEERRKAPDHPEEAADIPESPAPEAPELAAPETPPEPSAVETIDGAVRANAPGGMGGGSAASPTNSRPLMASLGGAR